MKSQMDKEDYPKMYLYKRIVQAKLFIDEHFAEYINVDNISDEACFSKFHFIRLFKKAYGKTPHQYLTSVRIENAKNFIRENLTITETCFSVGFDSVSSFTGLFKKIVGVTPSDYRLNELTRLNDTQKRPLKYIPGCYAMKSGLTQKSNIREVK